MAQMGSIVFLLAHMFATQAVTALKAHVAQPAEIRAGASAGASYLGNQNAQLGAWVALTHMLHDAKEQGHNVSSLEHPAFNIASTLEKLPGIYPARWTSPFMSYFISKGGELCYEGKASYLRYVLLNLQSDASNVRYGFDNSTVQRGFCRDHGFIFGDDADSCYWDTHGVWYGATWYGDAFKVEQLISDVAHLMNYNNTNLYQSINKILIQQGMGHKEHNPDYVFPKFDLNSTAARSRADMNCAGKEMAARFFNQNQNLTDDELKAKLVNNSRGQTEAFFLPDM
jgi:hypothetical protein